MAENEYLTEKLYSPIFCTLWEDSDVYHDDSIELNQYAAVQYMDTINKAFHEARERDAEPSGLMAYYDESDAVNEKVFSLYVDVETHDGRLWGVATLELTEPLTVKEMDTLKEYIEGQYSDGFGEGFEQRYIDVDGGELQVHLWKYDGQFFIDSSLEFERRLGFDAPLTERSDAISETPAQAALHEPDAFDDPATVALRERLIQRLDKNLSAYFDRFQNLMERQMIDLSAEIAAYAGAHFYLTERHNFHISELEYLMQFKNPLAVIADQFELESGIEDHSAVMWNIFDKQDALQGGYELMGDTPAQESLSPEDRLRARLAENFSEYKESMLALSKEELFDAANEAASTLQAYSYLTETDFTEAEVNYLLKFQDPLDVVSDRLDARPLEIGATVRGIFQDQQWTLQNGGYALMPEERAPAAAEPPGKVTGAAEKPSVMEQIRKAREESKTNPAPQKEHPGKDRGPEL